ncbi:MAG: hypothetical protein JSV70_01580 [bacterium]|nr:MAG: hypothetical protein JSV70_01580 [bacterium]
MEPGTWNLCRRLAGAVRIRDEKVLDAKYNVTGGCGVIKAGKKFLKIINY